MIGYRRRAGNDRRLAQPWRMSGGSASLPRTAGATPRRLAPRRGAAEARPPGPAVVADRTSVLLFAALRSPVRFALKGVI